MSDHNNRGDTRQKFRSGHGTRRRSSGGSAFQDPEDPPDDLRRAWDECDGPARSQTREGKPTFFVSEAKTGAKLKAAVYVLVVMVITSILVFRSEQSQLQRARRAGADALRPSADRPAGIPKIIHQYLYNASTVGALSKRHEAWHGEWKRLFPSPEYTHMLWSEATANAFMQQHFKQFHAKVKCCTLHVDCSTSRCFTRPARSTMYVDFCWQVFTRYRMDIQRADASRYFILYVHVYGAARSLRCTRICHPDL
jgi:hypothetical protein